MKPLLIIVKLSPIFVLCGLVMNGFDTLMAAPIALLYAAIICWLTTKRKVMDILDSALGGVKDAMMVFFIFMLAYAVATFFMTTGVGASVILAAIKLGVSGRSVAVVAFLVSCVLSMATGTSWGTFAATIPIFMWLGHIVGGDPVMTMCACAGGAAFGDNVALISDTTIMTCAIQKVEVVDRFNKQLAWSLTNVAIIGNMLLSDDQAQMATMGPVIKDIVDEGVEGSEKDLYDLRCRNAMYGDAIGVLAGELIPWHVCNIYYVGLAGAVYPLMKFAAFDLIPLNFFAWISVLSLLILTLTGLDRFFPKFGLPKEPAVRLKKYSNEEK